MGASFKDYTIISVLKTTRQRFRELKKEYSGNPEGKDQEFLIDLMDFLEQNSEKLEVEQDED